VWDVDGTGLQRIVDPALAAALLDKVNKFNLATSVKAIPIVAVLACLPNALVLLERTLPN